MANIGIFFGTDTGKTRKIAKMIHKQLGEAAAAPVNINRATLADLLDARADPGAQLHKEQAA